MLDNQVVLPAIHAPLGASFQHRLCVTLQAMNTSSSSRTRLAILGTISDLHREPLAYDLNCLRSLVADLAPDLLCAEITREAWEGGDLSSATVEVREALAPVGAATDIVIVPVASTPKQYLDFAPSEQWRRDLVLAFDRLLQWGQRKASRTRLWLKTSCKPCNVIRAAVSWSLCNASDYIAWCRCCAPISIGLRL